MIELQARNIEKRHISAETVFGGIGSDLRFDSIGVASVLEYIFEYSNLYTESVFKHFKVRRHAHTPEFLDFCSIAVAILTFER